MSSAPPHGQQDARRLRPSSGQLAYLLERERHRRRHKRWQEVRAQAGGQGAAKRVRQRVQRAQEEARREETRRALDAFCQAQRVELAALEDEYLNALKDLGVGKRDAREAAEQEAALAEKEKNQRTAWARERGRAAGQKVRLRREVEQKAAEEKRELRRGVRTSEDLRAAGVIRVAAASRDRMALIEVNEQGRQTKKWVQRTELEAESEASVRVNRIPLAEVGNRVGLEAAIREQEERRREHQLAEEVRRQKTEMARQERQRQLRRKMEEQETWTTTTTTTTDDDDIDESQRLSTIQELTEEATSHLDEDLDLIPTKVSSPPAPPLEPTPRMGGPSSAFSPLPPSLPQDDLDSIRRLLDRVQGQKNQLNDDGVVSGEGNGAKNDDADRSFVAKVLGVSSNELRHRGGVENTLSTIVEREEEETTMTMKRVHVRVNVEEVSMQTSSSASTSSDITKERFLTQPLKRGVPGLSREQERRFLQQQQQQQLQQQQEQRHNLTDYSSIHSLIEELKSPGVSSSSSTPANERERRGILRHYIEKLLNMKREEIAQLSVTESSSSVIAHSTTSFSSTSYSVSASSSKSFVASTPTSILSSSDSRSSVGSKTVRFQDDLDGTYQQRQQLEDEQRRIQERTQLSLSRVRDAFEEKKREIEAQLERRRRRKEEETAAPVATAELRLQQEQQFTHSDLDMFASAILLEGPLSDSTLNNTVARSKSDSHLSSRHSSSSSATNSAKESSLSSPAATVTAAGENADGNEDMADMMERLRLRWTDTVQRRMQHQQQTLNKSSSSGSSGSAAAAQFRAQLRQLEMPKLSRARSAASAAGTAAAAARPTSHSDDTLLRVTDIQSDEPVPVPVDAPATAIQSFSSFHLSPDDDDDIGDEPEISYISLSTDSDDEKGAKKRGD